MRLKRGLLSYLRQIVRGFRYAWQVLLACPQLLFNCFFCRRPILYICRLSAIGDIVCTLPSVATFRQRHSRLFIVYETGYSYMPLVRRCRDVDLVVEGGSWQAKLLQKVVKPEMLFRPLLPDEQLPPQPVRRIHLVEEFQRGFGLASLVESPVQLGISARASRQVRRRLRQEQLYGKPFVVIHTGPTWNVREWPESHWCHLVAELKANNQIEVIQIGEDRTSVGESRKAPRPGEARNWVGKLTLDQTLVLLRMADLFVGIDSGVLHMAGAMDTPCVGIFGPTDPLCRLPRNRRAVAVTSNVSCLGCHHGEQGPGHWRSGCPHDIRCMSELTVKEVFSACDKLLKGQNRLIQRCNLS